MIPSNLENMGKCLPLIRRVRCRQLNYASSSLGIRAFLQLHSWCVDSSPAPGELFASCICRFCSALLSARRTGYTLLVSAIVTRPLCFATRAVLCLNPSDQSLFIISSSALYEGKNNVQTRPECNHFPKYLSVKYFIWIIFGPFNLDETRYSR